MSNLPICLINSTQEQMAIAFEDLYAACQKKREADVRQEELKDDPVALAEFQPEWTKTFNERTEKRIAANTLVKAHPEVAGDLIERLVRYIKEHCDEG